MNRKEDGIKKSKRGVPLMHDLILEAVKERKVFIGYHMLCRYLNGRGYIRYGCNAGYNKPYTNGKDRINPCPVLCPETKIYRTKVYYWCLQLEKENKLFLEKRKYFDSKNPHSKTEPHKFDIFVFIALSKKYLDKFFNTKTLDPYL